MLSIILYIHLINLYSISPALELAKYNPFIMLTLEVNKSGRSAMHIVTIIMMIMMIIFLLVQ